MKRIDLKVQNKSTCIQFINLQHGCQKHATGKGYHWNKWNWDFWIFPIQENESGSIIYTSREIKSK